MILISRSNGFLMWTPDTLNKMSTFMIYNPNSAVHVCEAIDFYKSHVSINYLF